MIQKFFLLSIFLFTNQNVKADFQFDDWNGVEDALGEEIAQESHPIFGKLYRSFISNIRFFSGLYNFNDEINKDSEYVGYALLLKKLFPSITRTLQYNKQKDGPISKLIPEKIGKILKAIKNFKKEKNKKNFINELSNVLEGIDEQAKNGLNDNKDISEKFDKPSHLAKAILQSVKSFNNDSKILPKNLTEITFLVFFWSKFEKEENIRNFIKGLTGNENFKSSKEEISSDIPKSHSLEKDIRYLIYGEEQLFSFAYSNSNPPKYGQTTYNNVKFPDCMEAVLMAIVDLALFYKCKFNYNHLKKDELKSFYQNRIEKGYSENNANSWAQIVDGLELGNIYKDNKCNISTGIENIFLILKKITGYEKNIPKDLEKDGALWLSEFLGELSNNFYKFYVSFENLEHENNQYEGNINIKIKNKENNSICDFVWEIKKNKHSEIKNFNVSSNLLFEKYEENRDVFVKKNKDKFAFDIEENGIFFKNENDFVKIFSRKLNKDELEKIIDIANNENEKFYKYTIKKILIIDDVYDQKNIYNNILSKVSNFFEVNDLKDILEQSLTYQRPSNEPEDEESNPKILSIWLSIFNDKKWEKLWDKNFLQNYLKKIFHNQPITRYQDDLTNETLKAIDNNICIKENSIELDGEIKIDDKKYKKNSLGKENNPPISLKKFKKIKLVQIEDKQFQNLNSTIEVDYLKVGNKLSKYHSLSEIFKKFKNIKKLTANIIFDIETIPESLKKFSGKIEKENPQHGLTNFLKNATNLEELSLHQNLSDHKLDLIEKLFQNGKLMTVSYWQNGEEKKFNKDFLKREKKSFFSCG